MARAPIFYAWCEESREFLFCPAPNPRRNRESGLFFFCLACSETRLVCFFSSHTHTRARTSMHLCLGGRFYRSSSVWLARANGGLPRAVRKPVIHVLSRDLVVSAMPRSAKVPRLAHCFPTHHPFRGVAVQCPCKGGLGLPSRAGTCPESLSLFRLG